MFSSLGDFWIDVVERCMSTADRNDLKQNSKVMHEAALNLPSIEWYLHNFFDVTEERIAEHFDRLDTNEDGTLQQAHTLAEFHEFEWIDPN